MFSAKNAINSNTLVHDEFSCSFGGGKCRTLYKQLSQDPLFYWHDSSTPCMECKWPGLHHGEKKTTAASLFY